MSVSQAVASEAMAKRFVDDEKAMQRRYDAETRHGLAASRQAAWEADVARRLAALRSFAEEEE